MYILHLLISCATIWREVANQELVYENDMNFRVEAGSRTCFFERGQAGQILEAKYQVLDGQHGDYDISFEVIDPNGVTLVSDHKQPHNSLILDLEVAGDYVFCLDNSHSVMNSKLVFVYILFEDREEEKANVQSDEGNSTVTEEGHENAEEKVLEWTGTDENGEAYYVEVAHIADSVTRTLRHVVKARHALNLYGALKTRDTYLAFEDTFIVDLWSGFQISFMCIVGLVQVYMIKKLFSGSAPRQGFY